MNEISTMIDALEQTITNKPDPVRQRYAALDEEGFQRIFSRSVERMIGGNGLVQQAFILAGITEVPDMARLSIQSLYGRYNQQTVEMEQLIAGHLAQRQTILGKPID